MALDPTRNMIYETASPIGPVLSGPFAHCIYAYYLDNFRIFIYPHLYFDHTGELFCQFVCAAAVPNMSLIVRCSSSSKTQCFLCHSSSHNQQNQGPSTVFFEQNGCLGGNRGDFHVQMSVSPLPAITGPSSPEIGA